MVARNIPGYGPILTANLISDRGKELKDMLLDQTASLEDQRYHPSYSNLNFLPPNLTFPIEAGL